MSRFTYQDLIKGLKSKSKSNILMFTGPDIGVPDFKSILAYLQQEFLYEFKLPNGGKSIFDLEYFKKRPEAFTKFAKEFLVHEDFDGVYLNQVKLTHIFARYL